MKTNFAALAVALAAATSATSALPHVDQGLHRALQSADSVNLVITLKHDTRRTLRAFDPAAYATRGEMIEALKAKLEAASALSSAEVMDVLDEANGSTRQLFSKAELFWISSQIVVTGATRELVEVLKQVPSISSIDQEVVAERVDGDVVFNPVSSRRLQTSTLPNWGIKRIQAHNVWAQGVSGTGVVVGSIDTGVLGSHEILKDSFVGEYGWFDPEAKKKESYDLHGLGTHAMGVLVGSKNIGVAPGAKWMACKGCRATNCPQADLLACAQFMLCPTDTDGNNADCTKAPRLVTNSWSAKHTLTFKPIIDAWEKAGIIPIFPIGTKGPACGTVYSPGDYPNVIGVGTTNPANVIWDHSARGPSVDGLIKPDISAPGTITYSAFNANNSDYQTIGGNGMSSSFVAGTIALLLSKNPSLTTAQIRETLMSTTNRQVNGFGLDWTDIPARRLQEDDHEHDDPTNFTCGNTTNSQWPNNQFGAGIVNAWNAFQQLFNGGVTTPAPTTVVPATTVPTTTVPATTAPATTAPPTSTPAPVPTTPEPTKQYC